MSKYKQLTQGQRYQIAALMEAGNRQNDIARLIGVSPGTVTRELGRNSSKKGYDPEKAQAKANKRRRQGRQDDPNADRRH